MIDSVIEMIYACDNCGFLFSRSTEPDQCPDCGKSAVRSANEVEREEFTARMNGQAGSEPSEPYPDAVETAIEEICCFKFKLPATALQIDSRMIMEIVVEHWINPNDQDTVMANVSWFWHPQHLGKSNAIQITLLEYLSYFSIALIKTP